MTESAPDDRHTLLITVEDLVGDFLYYNRKCDEELPLGRIEEMIKDGVVSRQDIVNHFAKALEEQLEDMVFEDEDGPDDELEDDEDDVEEDDTDDEDE